MNGVAITIEVHDLAAANALIARFASLDEAALLQAIGVIGEAQTRKRIQEEKTAPDGAAWAPNREGGSILHRSGEHLADSLAFEVGAGEVSWGRPGSTRTSTRTARSSTPRARRCPSSAAASDALPSA